MTYASGGLIQATDLQTRLTNFNQVWGTWSGGYGQANVTSASTSGTVVPASDWATLISKMSTAQQHQNNTTFSQAQPTSGSIITYLSSIVASPARAPPASSTSGSRIKKEPNILNVF